MRSDISPFTIAQRARTASLMLQAVPATIRSRVLVKSANLLQQWKRTILAANVADIHRARGKVSPEFIDRLTLDEKRFSEMIAAVKAIARQKDPLGEVMERKKLKNGVQLKKVRTPIGVLFVIYEARPHVTADAAALALRAGNAVILKGGSEARGANRLITRCFQVALKKTGLPVNAVQFIDTADRTITQQLLKLPDRIDLVIPRGGYGLVQWVRKESEIPSLSHAAGLDHTYVDKSADIPLAIKVIVNAKTNFPAACNSLDTLLVHTSITRTLLLPLAEALEHHHIEIRGDAITRQIIPAIPATAKDWGTEYLSLKMGIKIVRNVNEAIAHINRYGSKHSEGIIARDEKVIKKFKENIDAAAIFINCSTRLHDGGVFGLGAEMGINTGKLHARGPVGAKELTTYKWIAEGDGQIRM
ncbi:MAG: glutamate-5-semialdehyde dehydrogenase [Patescibacteria group bacterium]